MLNLKKGDLYMSIKFFVSIFVCFSLSFSIFANNQYGDGILAVIGEEVITAHDIMAGTYMKETLLKKNYTGEQLDKKIIELRENYADILLERILIYNEYKSLDFELPESLVNKRLDAIIATRAEGDRERFIEMLKMQDLTIEKFKETIHKDIVFRWMMNEFVYRDIHITPSEVLEYFRTHKDEFADSAKINIVYISIEKGKDASSAKKRAEDIYKKLAKGSDFDKISKKIKIEKGIKTGSFDWIEVTGLRTEFKNAFRKLEKKTVGTPVDLEDFYYILYIQDMKIPEKIMYSKKIYDKANRNLRKQKEKENYKEYIESLKKTTHIQKYY